VLGARIRARFARPGSVSMLAAVVTLCALATVRGPVLTGVALAALCVAAGEALYRGAVRVAVVAATVSVAALVVAVML
jgi:hypothetical protein